MYYHFTNCCIMVLWCQQHLIGAWQNPKHVASSNSTLSTVHLFSKYKPNICYHRSCIFLCTAKKYSVTATRYVSTETRYGPDGLLMEAGRGKIFRTGPDRPSALHSGYRDILPRVKWPGSGMAWITDPHLRPRLKKEYSNTSSPLLAFMAGYRVQYTCTL